MSDLMIFCSLSTADAIAARSSIAGDLDLALSESQLDELHLRGLAEVMAPFAGTEPVATRLPVKGTTWAHVLAALEGRNAALLERATERATAALLQGAQPESLERWRAGRMPPDEILSLARDKAFMTFAEFPRLVTARTFLTAKQVNHKGTCQTGAAGVGFDSYEYSGLTQQEYDVFRRYRQAAERARSAWVALGISDAFGDPVITTRVHRAKCSDCQAFLAKLTVHVSISWAGRALTREYQL